ncbi:hypothetical protein [Ancylobacter sp. FA202]|uniref:hypothetical protein n=1 Tax=Ancylobacter sp. FA202 TaxID=1111106 RepID=UPI0003A9E3BC|nr:hypothetical protein [Ancylobacter sp. FA202]
MIDKLEPSIDPMRARAGEDAGGGPRAPAAPSPAAHPPAAARAKGPPQDPVAFQRWLGIEQLKVQMRRLELENKRAEAPAPRASRAALPVLYGLVLVILLALVAFLAAQVLSLREDVSTLRSAQGTLEERVQALEMPPPAPQAAAPQAAAPAATAMAPAAPTPAAPSNAQPAPATPGTAATAPADALVPLAGTTPMPAPATAPPAVPALPGAGYTVRIFAPINTVTKARVEAFTAPLKAAGFDVVVSDTGVVQTTSNTLSFHAGSADMANEVAEIIRKRRPALGVELRASPSIPESARQVLILNLTEDAFG